jgi:hypothetical protein
MATPHQLKAARNGFVRRMQTLFEDDSVQQGPLEEVMVRCGRVKTTELARRYIHNELVRLDGQLAVDPLAHVGPGTHILRVNRNKPKAILVRND